MARIVEYAIVFERLSKLGFVCNYHNSGAFSPANLETSNPPSIQPSKPQNLQTSNPPTLLGWVGPPDLSIRPELYPRIRQIDPPDAASLAALTCRAWRELFSGPAWIMPNSHWAYELEYGFKQLPSLLQQAGIDPAALRGLTRASALEFSPASAPALQSLIQGLLQHMDLSDFTLALPDAAIVATLHHNQQVWWMASEPVPIARLEQL